MELIKSKLTLHLSQKHINRGASFRWWFGPLSSWGSIETTTILTTHPSLFYFRKRNLEREQDEIKKENTQRKQEIQTLKEVIELKKNEAEREKKYLKEALEEQEELKNQLSSDEFNLPQTLEKDIDKLKRQNDNQKRAKVGFQIIHCSLIGS